jgi:vitamin K-dependent gamma-carboxylase
VFRIAFGLAMAVNARCTCRARAGVLHRHHGPLPVRAARLRAPLPGSGHVRGLRGDGGHRALIALGRWHRLAAWSFFLLTTYVFLIDSTYFQNHEYLISLLALLLRSCRSTGAGRSTCARTAERRSDTVPAWVLWLLRFQIGVPYFFGGIAKLNADWLQGEPLRPGSRERSDIAAVDAVALHEPVVWFMTYGALVLDLRRRGSCCTAHPDAGLRRW